jgi:hypothetical protein
VERGAGTSAVLAMGDFDALTMPFVERHDNRQLGVRVISALPSADT